MLLEYYFEQQRHYESKYGTDTVVLLMKGSFYEAYATEEEGKAVEVARLLNFVLTRANKKIPDVSISNPYMVGVPSCSVKKHIDILVSHMFTVVLIDQDPKDPTVRKVANICSPGTHDTAATGQDHRSVCCIYAEGTHDGPVFGIAALNVTIGECVYAEVTRGLTHKRLEDVYRIVEMHNPVEVICVYETDAVYKLCRQMECYPKVHSRAVDATDRDIRYQNEVLSRAFFTDGMLTPIEHLDLEMHGFARVAIVSLLGFCFDHNVSKMTKLQAPKLHDDRSTLVLHNNSIYQIGVLTQGGDKSLFDIVNFTSTSLGRRRLRADLLRPHGNAADMEESYDRIERAWPLADKMHAILKNVCDVERLHRKATIGQLHPSELTMLHSSYCSIRHLLEMWHDNRCANVDVLIGELEAAFDLDNCNCALESLEASVVKAPQESIDAMTASIQRLETQLQRECDKLSRMIDVQGSVRLEKGVLYTTATRGRALQKIAKEYTFVFEKTRAKISSSTIDNARHRLMQLREDIRPLAQAQYLAEIQKLYCDRHADLCEAISSYVADTDALKSKVMCARRYGYSRPFILNGDAGSVSAKGLRHAIVERLNAATNYVPNDVVLDGDTSGILLYGVNGAGKSCYSKAIGLAIVLAQSGHYVPASSMELCPFTRLYTRISDADNIYKGQSSFFVEMNELKSIIHYADKRSIVLGDEVCKGTEDISALAIVAATLNWLIERNARFVFATHLNRLPTMSILKDERRLSIKHVAVYCDGDTDTVTYTREILDGMGTTLYGLEIAKGVIQNDDFAKLAEGCRGEVTNGRTKIVSKKRSKYNSSVFVDRCQIDGCNSTDSLDTHHIVFQACADSGDKNIHGTGNLVTVCKRHHSDIHSGSIVVDGWVQTTKGRRLAYRRVHQTT